MPPAIKIDPPLLKLLRQALDEDIGTGDVTTDSIIPARMRGEGELIAKARGILCGAPIAQRIWRLVSPKVRLDWRVEDGQRVTPGQVLLRLSGHYRALLLGERVALNFLQRLSGIATLTDKMIIAAGGEKAPALCDTRKTTPLWRKLERYAVRVGGGTNHRFGLFDMVLIKENHARAAGSVGVAIRMARAAHPRLRIMAEARTEEEVRQACAERADMILLDNMTPSQIRRVVKAHGPAGIPFEVSGGIGLGNIAAYARTGVSRISIGALTHSAPALDLSLQLYPAGNRNSARGDRL